MPDAKDCRGGESIGTDLGRLCADIAERLAMGTRRVVFAESCTAGQVAATLAAVPGISQFLCGSAVTYRNGTKATWLHVPCLALDRYGAVSLVVANRMAVGVLENTPEADLSLSITGHLGPGAPNNQDGLVYVGAALRDRVHRGVIARGVQTFRLASGDRVQRQREAARLVLSRLRDLLSPSAPVREDEIIAAVESDDCAAVRLNGAWSLYHRSDSSMPRPAVLYPGAFDPLHSGHRRIAEVAEQILGAQAMFEIAVVNVDKPPIEKVALRKRLAQFSLQQTVWLTRRPTFMGKARWFPGVTFLVGVDTIQRVGDIAYYGGDVAKRDQAIEELVAMGCRFLVYGRLLEREFVTLEACDLPSSLREVCDGVPETLFREDISSTKLRQREG